MEDRLVEDTLFLACTRPAMVAGVPMEAMGVNVILTGVVFLAGGNLFYLLVASGADLVELSVGVQVMNALLLPIVLGFLFLLARRVLPEPYRLKGPYAVVVGATIALTAGLGLYAGIAGLLA